MSQAGSDGRASAVTGATVTTGRYLDWSVTVKRGGNGRFWWTLRHKEKSYLRAQTSAGTQGAAAAEGGRWLSNVQAADELPKVRGELADAERGREAKAREISRMADEVKLLQDRGDDYLRRLGRAKSIIVVLAGLLLFAGAWYFV